MGEADEIRGDRRVLRVVLDALDEGAVDLDHVDREAPQLAERREAGAEVVDGDSHPELVQLLELGPGPLAGMAFLDDRGLGDLQAQEARRQLRGRERLANERADASRGELLTGEVDPRDESFREHLGPQPAGRLGTRLVEHVLAERHDEPGRLGDGDELRGRNRASRRRVPA